MVVFDGQGIPLGSHIDPASPAEVTLAEKTLAKIRVHGGWKGRPKARSDRVIADKGYDSDPLRQRSERRGITLMSPYRKNRKNKRKQDRRMRDRYTRRYTMDRTFARFGSFRRLTVRYENHVGVYTVFFHIACFLITMMWL
jgi:IS5 family transposase